MALTFPNTKLHEPAEPRTGLLSATCAPLTGVSSAGGGRRPLFFPQFCIATRPGNTEPRSMQELFFNLEFRIQQQLSMIEKKLYQARSLPTPPLDNIADEAGHKTNRDICDKEFDSHDMRSNIRNSMGSNSDYPPSPAAPGIRLHQCSVCNRSFEVFSLFHNILFLLAVHRFNCKFLPIFLLSKIMSNDIMLT